MKFNIFKSKVTEQFQKLKIDEKFNKVKGKLKEIKNKITDEKEKKQRIF